MHLDQTNQYRSLLESDPPEFADRVDSPWDQVPDCPTYNGSAYRRIVRDLERLKSEGKKNDTNRWASGVSSRGILILGEAGTGKTHLLMRVAKNLSGTNHILFVRKPNNEEAVAQHIWANIVNSLSRSLPNTSHNRSQLDDLLAHAFSAFLIPEFEKDIAQNVNISQRQRWVSSLREDPYNLFSLIGEGETRFDTLKVLRNRVLKYLKDTHPNVDQRIAHALITYCFVTTPGRKRSLLTWLAGQDIDESEAQQIGLPPTWVEVQETGTDTSAQQQAEEQALRAIGTIGILSTYYQPLILAFDQLEGLRGEERLTQRWGDVVREIFTMTPNFLILTCIFPSLWNSWFSEKLDQSAAQRISQQSLELEKFGPLHATSMLITHMEPTFIRHRLPDSIYPFTEDDITKLCKQASSPRIFIQKARSLFETWQDGDIEQPQPENSGQSEIVTQRSIDDIIYSTIEKFEKEYRANAESYIPIEQDVFGRIRNVLKTILDYSGQDIEYKKATCGYYVMPPNLVVKNKHNENSLCLAVAYGTGNSFAARIRNLKKALQEGKQFKHVIIIRDSRCKPLGPKSKEYIEEIEDNGGSFLAVSDDQVIQFNALYDTFVAVEEHDLAIGSYEIDKQQLIQTVRNNGTIDRIHLLRTAGRLSPWIEAAIRGNLSPTPIPEPKLKTPEIPGETPKVTKSYTYSSAVSRPPEKPNSMVDILIGETDLQSHHFGVLGELKDGKKRLAISLTKPQCLVVLGYMGSGKSYSLGVLIENALLAQKDLIHQTRPMSVVAFNYRRNAEARFEYGGFSQPNTNKEQTSKLLLKYGARPDSVNKIRVFGYEPELNRRKVEYGEIPTYPIQFRPDELGANHWEILMKPPSTQSEYMDVVRDIIQKLFYQERLTFKNLERQIQVDERLSESQRQRALNRLSFARNWISDERDYEWGDILQEGSLNIFDLRMQTLTESEALKLCLIVTDLVRRTRNGVNKMVVFDEAHEYVDCKELVGELENAITQIRHDGLSFILASQFPERIPERIFKYLLTRLIFKLPTTNAIKYLRGAAPNLQALSQMSVSNLDLEQGVCFIQTDDDCSDQMLRSPHLLEIRPRCTQHGGNTVRNIVEAPSIEIPFPANISSDIAPELTTSEDSTSDDDDEKKTLKELHQEWGISWERFLRIIGIPASIVTNKEMTLGEARRLAAQKSE